MALVENHAGPPLSIADSLRQVAASETVSNLGAFIFDVAEAMDLKVTAGGMLTGPKAESGDLFYFNNWPASWLAVYRASGILEVDPIVRWAMASGAPITWGDLASRLDSADPARELFVLAARHGYCAGFALPVRTLAGHLGLLSLAGFFNDTATTEIYT